MDKRVQQAFKEGLIKIWKTKIKEDYNNGVLIKEGSLQIRLAHHIFSFFGDAFFKENGLILCSEFTFKKEWTEKDEIKRADLVLLDSNDYVLSIIELKYKHLNDRTVEKIKKDYQKMLWYSKIYGYSELFMGVISENVDDEDNCKSWIDIFKLKTKFRNVKITELILDEGLIKVY